jgi:hypothetical protein
MKMQETSKCTVAECNFYFHDILVDLLEMKNQRINDYPNMIDDAIVKACDMAYDKLLSYYHFQKNRYLMAATGMDFFSHFPIVLDPRFKLVCYDTVPDGDELKDFAKTSLINFLKEQQPKKVASCLPSFTTDAELPQERLKKGRQYLQE